MNIKVIVYHLNRDIAVAQGIASKTEHSFPTAEATLFAQHDAVKQLWESHCYEAVAVFTGATEDTSTDEALELAFTLTNSIDSGWFENWTRPPAITIFHETGYRSSSVGDIFLVITNKTRKLYVCKPAGFDTLR